MRHGVGEFYWTGGLRGGTWMELVLGDSWENDGTPKMVIAVWKVIDAKTLNICPKLLEM